MPGVFEPGSKFGVYSVGACIGEGGMARIYQAEHAGLRRQVALKVLIDGFARDPDGRQRFLREARIAAAIKHPNVVNIFDVGVHENIPYLVMELLQGQDLERLLESKGALDEALIIDIMVPVVAGLFAVHEAGIVHRDLKPGNIFLATGRHNDLEPKLLDFGISKAAGVDQLKLTANRTLIGTPFYISPEGLHGADMTPLSDQYSLGVVMYECATGFTPFSASTFIELFKLITTGQYAPPSTHKPQLSRRLEHIIARAMSLQPEQRFADLREMGRELLLMAGHRTRITWGLSFGEAKDTLASNREVGASPGKPSERPAAMHEIKSAPRALLFAILSLFALGLGLAAWLSGSAFDRTTARPVSTAGLVGRPTAEGGTTTVSAGGAVEAVASPPSASAVASDGPFEGAREPPAPGGPSDNKYNAAPRRDPRPPRPPEATSGRRPLRPAAATARQLNGSAPEPEPEWALPPIGSSPSPNRSGGLPIGANGAPIFD